MSRRLPLMLAALSGFVSLSYEILWARLFSFVSKGVAAAFGLLLGAYLLGLASGALASLRGQDEEHARSPAHLRWLADFFAITAYAGFLIAPATGLVAVHAHFLWTLPLFMLGAVVLGASLPLICHVGIPADRQVGRGLSHVYLANIFGATAGSLATGFLLMDRLPLSSISVLLAVLGFGAAAALARQSLPPGPGRSRRVLHALTAAVVTVAIGPALYDGLWERLQLKSDYEPGRRFAQVVETKSGVVTVDRRGVVAGGGAYDGKVSTDLMHRDWLVRPYALSALHPSPKRVLMIGLASGSWAQIVANNPDVDHLTVVEINPGYLQIIKRQPAVASLLTNPNVDIVIDDGRRWLNAHPVERFDAIVFNVTHSWRGFASNVLSKEFLELVRSRLAPGGLYLFNTTFSRQAQRTAISVFPHALMVINTLAVSDTPLVFNVTRWRKALTRYRIDGKAVIDVTTARGRDRLEAVLALADRLDTDPQVNAVRLVSRDAIEAATRHTRIVTDDNMATEWRLPSL